MQGLDLTRDDYALITAALFEFYYTRKEIQPKSETAERALEIAREIAKAEWPE